MSEDEVGAQEPKPRIRLSARFGGWALKIFLLFAVILVATLALGLMMRDEALLWMIRREAPRRVPGLREFQLQNLKTQLSFRPQIELRGLLVKMNRDGAEVHFESQLVSLRSTALIWDLAKSFKGSSQSPASVVSLRAENVRIVLPEIAKTPASASESDSKPTPITWPKLKVDLQSLGFRIEHPRGNLHFSQAKILSDLSAPDRKTVIDIQAEVEPKLSAEAGRLRVPVAMQAEIAEWPQSARINHAKLQVLNLTLQAKGRAELPTSQIDLHLETEIRDLNAGSTSPTTQDPALAAQLTQLALQHAQTLGLAGLPRGGVMLKSHLSGQWTSRLELRSQFALSDFVLPLAFKQSEKISLQGPAKLDTSGQIFVKLLKGPDGWIVEDAQSQGLRLRADFQDLQFDGPSFRKPARTPLLIDAAALVSGGYLKLQRLDLRFHTLSVFAQGQFPWDDSAVLSLQTTAEVPTFADWSKFLPTQALSPKLSQLATELRGSARIEVNAEAPLRSWKDGQWQNLNVDLKLLRIQNLRWPWATPESSDESAFRLEGLIEADMMAQGRWSQGVLTLRQSTGMIDFTQAQLALQTKASTSPAGGSSAKSTTKDTERLSLFQKTLGQTLRATWSAQAKSGASYVSPKSRRSRSSVQQTNHQPASPTDRIELNVQALRLLAPGLDLNAQGTVSNIMPQALSTSGAGASQTSSVTPSQTTKMADKNFAPEFDLQFKATQQLKALRGLLPYHSHLLPTGQTQVQGQLIGQWHKAGLSEAPLSITAQIKADLDEVLLPPSAEPKPGAVKPSASQAPLEPLLPPWPIVKNSDLNFNVRIAKLRRPAPQDTESSKARDLNITGIQTSGRFLGEKRRPLANLPAGSLDLTAQIQNLFDGKWEVKKARVDLRSARLPIEAEAEVRGTDLQAMLGFASPEFGKLISGKMDALFRVQVPNLRREPNEIPKAFAQRLLQSTEFKTHSRIRQGFISSQSLDQLINEKLSSLPGLGSGKKLASKGLASDLEIKLRLNSEQKSGKAFVDRLISTTPEKNEVTLQGELDLSTDVKQIRARLQGEARLAQAEVGGAIAEANRDSQGRLVIPLSLNGPLTQLNVDIAQQAIQKMLERAAQVEGQKLKRQVEGRAQEQIQRTREEAEKKIQDEIKKRLGL